MTRSYLCVARGHDDAWEAMCVDLDIAVAGRSYEEVQTTLQSAIRSYIDDALSESEETRSQLLNRRAPWHVRLSLGFDLFMHSLFGGRHDDGQFEAHRLPCPA